MGIGFVSSVAGEGMLPQSTLAPLAAQMVVRVCRSWDYRAADGSYRSCSKRSLVIGFCNTESIDSKPSQSASSLWESSFQCKSFVRACPFTHGPRTTLRLGANFKDGNYYLKDLVSMFEQPSALFFTVRPHHCYLHQRSHS